MKEQDKCNEPASEASSDLNDLPVYYLADCFFEFVPSNLRYETLASRIQRTLLVAGYKNQRSDFTYGLKPRTRFYTYDQMEHIREHLNTKPLRKKKR